MATKGGSGGLANKVIAYSFTVGVVIALVLGLVSTWLSDSTQAVLTSLLILAGIIVGFFNIQPSEARDYVLYSLALVIVTSLGQGVLGHLQYIGVYLESILSAIMSFILPSVIIVGIKSILNLAKN